MFYANQSLSHGTMLNADLLQTFGSALERACGADGVPLAQYQSHSQLANEAFALIENGATETPDASDVVAELFDALQCYAPAGCTFGSHEGDGSDYGFWRDECAYCGEPLESGDCGDPECEANR